MNEKNETLTGNGTTRTIDLVIEELEPIQAPGVNLNHNETFVCR